MNPKYQVFLSSTYDDLKEERDQVIRAVLEMGHIPVGMEMFSAADDQQWKIITRHIDESDYYIVIVAHRYGSVIDGVSYTEKEYDYAVAHGVPVVGFIIDAVAPWPADRLDLEAANKAALDAFKAKVRKKPIGTWSSTLDLYGKVPIALMKLFTANPRPGWVRATGAASPEMVAELTRLSSENAQLRSQVSAARDKSEADRENELRKLLLRAGSVKVTPSVWFQHASDWVNGEPTDLLSIFVMLAPQLITEYSSNSVGRLLAGVAGNGKPVRTTYPLPYNQVNTWLADLMALGLVEPSTRKHPVADKDQYWTLTDLGRSAYTWFRKLAMDNAAQAKMQEVEPEPPAPRGSRKQAPRKNAG